MNNRSQIILCCFLIVEPFVLFYNKHKIPLLLLPLTSCSRCSNVVFGLVLLACLAQKAWISSLLCTFSMSDCTEWFLNAIQVVIYQNFGLNWTE